MKKGLYVGVDESNHGRFPEIFVAVFSKLEKDIIKNKSCLIYSWNLIGYKKH